MNFNHRMVWAIALPMVISNITVPLLGLVDTIVVGHLDSEHYLAAVAVGATLFSFLFLGFNFLRMGTTGFAAQAFGADDHTEIRQVLVRASVLAIVIGTLLIVLQRPIIALALAVIQPEASVADITRGYFSIRILAAPASLMNVVFIGWFIGMQNSRTPLALMLLINITNIILDVIFVVYLGMLADGVALASVIAEYSGLLVGTAFAVKEVRKRHAGAMLAGVWNLQKFRALMSTNLDLWIRTLALQLAFVIFTAVGARQGSAVLAANALLLNFQHIMSYALDGFANAAEALVGRAMGAREQRALDQAVSLSRYWSILVAVGLAILFLLFGKMLIDAMTGLVSLRELSYVFLPWLIASPIISIWCFLYDGVFVGAMRSREMRNIMVLSTFAVFIPACFLVKIIGNHGLWFAFLLFMGARGVFMHRKWQQIRATPSLPT